MIVNLVNFILWLSVGAVIGWFASRMLELEQTRIIKPIPIKVVGSRRSES
jgi:hypothetical protein